MSRLIRKTLSALGLFCCAALAFSVAGAEELSSPETLSSRAIYSDACDCIAYSSNKNDFLRPFLLRRPFSDKPQVEAVELSQKKDFLAQSFSKDGRYLSLVADEAGLGVYDVFVYDLEKKQLVNISANSQVDSSQPRFSPTSMLLAYLENGKLEIKDLETGNKRRISRGAMFFQSFQWSADGSYLLLINRKRELSRYDLKQNSFELLWTSPRRNAQVRDPFLQGDSLLFSSDHEGEFLQIYAYDLESKVLKRVSSTANDHYSPRIGKDKGLVYKKSTDASYFFVKREGESEKLLSPKTGVSYQYFEHPQRPVLLYAGDEYPKSLYRWNKDKKALKNLLFDYRSSQGAAKQIRTSDGMIHFAYLPEGKAKRWLLWLHGGPYEEVSPRFNIYFELFARNGIGLLALNYPGSTGIGNSYELRGERDVIAKQLKGVERQIAEIADSELKEFDQHYVLGLSYGSKLAHRYAQKNKKRVLGLIDFSGTASSAALAESSSEKAELPPSLFIYGENDFAKRIRGRTTLLQTFRESGRSRFLEISGEGHFIRRRSSLGKITATMQNFFSGSFDVSNAHVPHTVNLSTDD